MYFKEDGFQSKHATKITIPSPTSVTQYKVKQGLENVKRCRKYKPPTNKSEPLTINIPGLDKVMHSPNDCHKLVWLAAVLGFYGMCIYQLVDRITLYFQAPIALDISIDTVPTIDFPSVTICPPYGTSIIHYKQYLLRNNKAKLNGLRNKINLEGIWEEFSIKKKQITVESSCRYTFPPDETSTNHDTSIHYGCEENLKMDMLPFPSFWGNCLRLTPATNLTYRGAWTFIKFRVNLPEEPSKVSKTKIEQVKKGLQSPKSITNAAEKVKEKVKNRVTRILELKTANNEKLQQLGRETVFIPHPRHVVPSHELAKLYYRVSKSTEVILDFRLKQFKFLNTAKNPCIDQKAANDCEQACRENRLNKSVSCSLPYMVNSPHQRCDDLKTADATQLTVEKVYREFDNCNCYRSCEKTLISFVSDFHASPNETAIFYINYPDNTIELITERFAYTFSALISDIGGSLGLCVGLCLFSFVELIVTPLQVIMNWMREKCIGRLAVVKPVEDSYC